MFDMKKTWSVPSHLHAVSTAFVWLVCLVLGTLVIVENASATLTVNSVTLNNVASITVLSGATISVVASETNTSNSNWGSTRIRTTDTTTNAQITTCFNTPDHNGNGLYSEIFDITAPATVGTYDVGVRAYTNNDCSGNSSATYTLSNGIIVIAPPTVTTGAASALTTTGATLNGTVSSNGASTTVTFDYGLTTGYGNTVTATQSPLAVGASGSAVSAALTGLPCNTLYHFRAKGVNNAGTTNGNDLTFTTSTCPTVTSIILVNPTPTALPSVSWTVTFSKNVTGVNSTDFAVAQTGGVSGATITSVTGSGTTWTVTASTGSGNGTLGLNMSNTTGVIPSVTNLPFTGQVYTIDKIVPTVSSIILVNPNPTALPSVSWTVTFSKNVTGVDATDFAVAQTGGVSGATITSVTGSGTIWTVVAATGGDNGNGTLGLNLVDNDSIIDVASNPLGGSGSGNGNFTGQVYTVNKPYCFTDDFNRADGAPAGNWVVAHESGTFGNPTISSQRLRLTSASTSVSTMAALLQLFPASGNKIVVEFDHFAYNGSGADGMCVVLSNASIAPVPGAFGGSLGYAPKQTSAGGDTTHAGFAGGWLGVALDEYGNFSNPTEGRTGGPGLRLDSVAIRGSGSLYTGYTYLAGTPTLATGIDNAGSTTPAPGYRYRITIDHTDNSHAYTSVERDTGTGYATLVSPFDAKETAGQATVPTNWYLSFTGSTGVSTNIHEIDNLKVCSTQSQPPTTLDHIRILHDGSANTCIPETITLQACADVPCSVLYLGTVTGTLPSIGTWGPSSSFSISGGQTTVTLAASGSVTLGATATSPLRPSTTTTCYNTTTGTNDCTLNFAAAGLLFDVPDHTSATSQLVTITDCTAQLANKTRNVKFWSTYLDPSSGTKQGSVVTGTGNADCATGYSALGTTYTGATTLSLAFSAAPSPKATFSLCYPDAGKMQLNARYDGAATNTPPDTGVVLQGNDTFVTKPALFALSNIKQTATPQLANPAAIDASGNKFVKTGEAFTATVTAQNAKLQTTPNFSKETNPEGVRLTATLFAPVGGANSTLTCKGSTTECVVPGGSSNFTNGATTITDLAWNEVGIITIAPIIGDRDYLGAGDITGTASGKVGRFIPDHFAITPGSVTEGCSGNFTYFGQDGFSTAFTLTAQNQAGTTTKNYTGAFAKLNLADWYNYTFTPTGLPSSPSSTLLPSTTTPTGSWNNGVASVTAKHKASRPATPVAPADTTISAKPTDSDLITAASLVAVHALTTPLRFGRLVLQNAYGPETDDHILPFQTQYLDNTAQWVTNTDDSCTTLATTYFIFGNYQQQLASNEMGSSHINVGLSTLTTIMGKGSLYLNKPSLGDGRYLGSVDVTAQIGIPLPWLQYEWVGAIDYKDDPTGRVNFGIYRGNDRIINWREIIR